MYPPNPQKKFQEPYSGTYYSCTGGVGIFFGSTSSFHPGGVNIAMADGSVRFIKDSIQSWQIVPGNWVPAGVTAPPAADGTCIWQMAPGTQVGVYQKLGTRNLGEVVSARRLLIDDGARRSWPGDAVDRRHARAALSAASRLARRPGSGLVRDRAARWRRPSPGRR